MEDSIFSIPFSEWSAAQGFEFTVLIPIITCIAILLGGIWTLYKYFKEKNRDFYSNILENVYAPLFEELVKMEYSRKLLKDSAKDKEGKKEFAIKNVPFIKWNGVRTNTKMEIGKTTVHQEEYNVFDFDERLKAIHDYESRLKYAPKDLVALIESYFFLKKVQGVPSYEDEKIKIQRLIRRNVIIGYKKYRRKLGLKDVSVVSLWYNTNVCKGQ